jgi:hypothetical protein
MLSASSCCSRRISVRLAAKKVGEHVPVGAAAQYAPGMSPCLLLKQTDGLIDASVGASILEGLDEMSTVNRWKLPPPLPRSVACANGTTCLVASLIDEDADAVVA